MDSEENNKNKEEIEKPAWQTPEIIDLNVEKTESGSLGNMIEGPWSWS